MQVSHYEQVLSSITVTGTSSVYDIDGLSPINLIFRAQNIGTSASFMTWSVEVGGTSTLLWTATTILLAGTTTAVAVLTQTANSAIFSQLKNADGCRKLRVTGTLTGTTATGSYDVFLTGLRDNE